MKSNFDFCKESARKSVSVKISEVLLRISLKNKKLQFKDVHVFPFDSQFNVFFSEKS